MKGVRQWMRGGYEGQEHWDPEHEVPWDKVRAVWEEHWDDDRPIKLEKSPPNLLRAQQIEQAFEPAYFLIMIGDPYAFCEGCYRRDNIYDLAGSARLWFRCAQHQIRNLDTLQNTHFLTYEDLTSSTETEVERLRRFLPELSDVRIRAPGKHSVLGRNQDRIWNINQLKTVNLKREEVREITRVLKEDEDLLRRLGYRVWRQRRGRRVPRALALFFVYLSRVARKMHASGLLSRSLVRWLEDHVVRIAAYHEKHYR